MSKKKMKVSSFFERSNEHLSPEAQKRADSKAKEIISLLKLAETRKKLGIKQVDVEGFKQADVSKIENRSDIKLSTLIEYLDSLGLSIKITGIDENNEEYEILKAN